jgi:hypothetical protein
VDNEKVVALLDEIRSSQKQHLEEYRRVANEALAIQKLSFEIQQNSVAQQKVAVDAQAKHLRLYRRALIAAALLVAAAVWFVAEHS